eukprot:jgi/Mesvir1/7003/Mv09139-RA.1
MGTATGHSRMSEGLPTFRVSYLDVILLLNAAFFLTTVCIPGQVYADPADIYSIVDAHALNEDDWSDDDEVPLILDHSSCQLDRTVLSAGSFHTCAVEAGGAARCWGWDSFGQSSPPRDALFRSVTSGNRHSCGIVHVDDSLRCWGANNFQQSSPPAGSFEGVSAGWDHTCGLTNEHTIKCWGRNSYGQASPPRGQFLGVSAGYGHSCAVYAPGHDPYGRLDNRAICWGLNKAGQCNISSPEMAFVSISAGWDHTCAMTADGMVVCWGGNSAGQSTPPPERFKSISARWQHTCGTTLSDKILCWGVTQTWPSQGPKGSFSLVSGGQGHACAVRLHESSVVCWGSNSNGQCEAPPRLVLESRGQEHPHGHSHTQGFSPAIAITMSSDIMRGAEDEGLGGSHGGGAKAGGAHSDDDRSCSTPYLAQYGFSTAFGAAMVTICGRHKDL